MHRFRLIFPLLGAGMLLFIASGIGIGGETGVEDQSAKYGDGPHVAYTFNKDYTAYGLGRGATSEEAAQRARNNCTGTGCGDGESGTYMPGCFAMFRLPDGTYKKLSRIGKLTEDAAVKIGKSKFGDDCRLEVILCSN